MFKVPESDSKKPENRFEFELNGKTYSVPKFSFATLEAAILFDQGRYAEGVLESIDDPEVRAIVRALNKDQFQALDEAWSEASRVSPGESEGSAGSSESTAGQ